MTEGTDPARREHRVTSALTAMAVLLALVVLVRFYTGAVNDQYSLNHLMEPMVDLNEADLGELILLPGIEETLARRILEARRVGGPFRDGEDLASRVEGIGPRKLAAMLEVAVISRRRGRP